MIKPMCVILTLLSTTLVSAEPNSVDKKTVTETNITKQETQTTVTRLNTNTSKPERNKSTPLIIESRVQGSQEQPNVIYIMPWQNVNEPIQIESKKIKIKMPEFKPLDPKRFKQQVQVFYQINTTTN
ncbi:hypothetical protein [Algibacillus agarilyticus]|uniref:hypothetical protein n=1 Tax=Algibacillus agarilyticus TaxID=2234133 RepID=UPI000DD04E32|nr:hypothetical protein [Algibacillus agarilyticus]